MNCPVLQLGVKEFLLISLALAPIFIINTKPHANPQKQNKIPKSNIQITNIKELKWFGN